MLGTREKLKACQGQYETMELLRAIESRYMQEGFLVREASVLKHSERDVKILEKKKKKLHLFLLQILEVPVTARDVEREHHTQVKRWRKTRGELGSKPAQRMHGARHIMISEPPSRQDLRQNPTIVVEDPQAGAQLKKEDKKSKKKKSVKKSPPIPEIPNPYPLPTEPQPPPQPQPQPFSQLQLKPRPPPQPQPQPQPQPLSQLEPQPPPPPPPTEPPAPPPVTDETPAPVPESDPDSLLLHHHQQHLAPPSDPPPAKEYLLQRSTLSLSSTEQDTYL